MSLSPKARVAVVRKGDGFPVYFPDGSEAAIFLWGLDGRKYDVYIKVDVLTNEVIEVGRQLDAALALINGKGPPDASKPAETKADRLPQAGGVGG